MWNRPSMYLHFLPDQIAFCSSFNSPQTHTCMLFCFSFFNSHKFHLLHDGKERQHICSMAWKPNLCCLSCRLTVKSQVEAHFGRKSDKGYRPVKRNDGAVIFKWLDGTSQWPQARQGHMTSVSNKQGTEVPRFPRYQSSTFFRLNQTLDNE